MDIEKKFQSSIQKLFFFFFSLIFCCLFIFFVIIFCFDFCNQRFIYSSSSAYLSQQPLTGGCCIFPMGVRKGLSDPLKFMPLSFNWLRLLQHFLSFYPKYRGFGLFFLHPVLFISLFVCLFIPFFFFFFFFFFCNMFLSWVLINKPAVNLNVITMLKKYKTLRKLIKSPTVPHIIRRKSLKVRHRK